MWYANVGASSEVPEAGVVGGPLPLPEDIEAPQLDLVVNQHLFAGTVGRVDSRNLLVFGVEVVQPPVHHGDASRLGNGVVLASTQYNLRKNRFRSKLRNMHDVAWLVLS